MSIRTNPMKAVPVLLKRVKTARTKFIDKARDDSLDGKLEKLTWELDKIKDLFMRVKKNEEELLDILTEVDGHLRKLDSKEDKKRLDQDMDDICKRISDSAHKLLPMDAFDSSQEDHKTRSSTQHNMSDEVLYRKTPRIPKGFLGTLEDKPRHCLESLSIFPEHALIKKRRAIYWWIGQDLITATTEKTAEEVGQDVINDLLEFHLIVPYGNGKHPVVNKFKINPHIRPELESYVSGENYPPWLVLQQKNVFIPGDDGDRLRHGTSPWKPSVFNVGASYLNFQSKWLAKMENCEVLQLGRWQDSPSHHIEVGSEEFLDELRNLKPLKYLSLRGISRISGLPSSIAQLNLLHILDLKACHNLETLPNDVGSMTSLTHLILSQCYLLEGMPKGIEKLTELQVLKGFVIGSSSKTPCTISDLVNLKKLKRLSIHIIHIGSESEIKGKMFQSLGELSTLEHLKISWGVPGTEYSGIQITLPSSLKKLHLEGFRGQGIPEWLMPSKLPGGFTELNITGGKLESMNGEDTKQWSMEIVRLKYLKHFKDDLTNLTKLFPLLKYAEIKQIRNNSDFEGSVVPIRVKTS